MVRGWLWRYWMLTRSLAFPSTTMCMWQTDTQTVTAAQPSTQWVMSQVENACFPKPPCFPVRRLCYGRTDWTAWLYWRVLGSAASPPPGLFLGVLLWLLLCTGGLSVCSSWRVWRAQISAEITPRQLDTLCLPGNDQQGRREQGNSPPPPTHTHTHVHTCVCIAVRMILKAPLQYWNHQGKMWLFWQTI